MTNWQGVAPVEPNSSSEACFEWWGQVDYETALDRMTLAHKERVAGGRPDSFFYLEHPAVITYGRSTPPEELTRSTHQIPAHAVPRGGLATYHAPGQMVGYIVLDLSRRAGGAAPDIHAYLRAIEQGLIDFLKSEFDLDATRRRDFTGVWTPGAADGSHPGRKLASIGVSARKWVTSHGFALNIDPDMSGFQAIVPCGITDAEMTSVKLEFDRAEKQLVGRSMKDWAGAAHNHIRAALAEQGW